MVEVLPAGRVPASELVEDDVVTVPPDLSLVEVTATLVDSDTGAVVAGAGGQ